MQLDPTRNLANSYLQSDTTSSTEEYNIKLARFVRFCQLMRLDEQKETQAELEEPIAWAPEPISYSIQIAKLHRTVHEGPISYSV